MVLTVSVAAAVVVSVALAVVVSMVMSMQVCMVVTMVVTMVVSMVALLPLRGQVKDPVDLVHAELLLPHLASPHSDVL